MKRGKILEQIWYANESLRVTEWTEETEKLLRKLEDREEILFADLTPEQKDVLDTYKTDVTDLTVLFEKEAFMKGVQFATSYMIEALGQSGDR